MISAIYIVISSILIGRLSLVVIKARRKYKISVGNNGNEELNLAIAAHSTNIEYLPIALLLLLVLEFNGAGIIVIHITGIILIVSRMVHTRGLLAANLKQRIIGMQMTFFTILSLAAMNLVYLPYNKLFDF